MRRVAALDAARTPRVSRGAGAALAVPAALFAVLWTAGVGRAGAAGRPAGTRPAVGGAAGSTPQRGAAALPAAPAGRRVLRVCADPNNLPFSNARGEGFENKLAELAAREMGARLSYVWWAQRRGFVRNTLRAGACDVIPGVPARLDAVLATRPYYRSTYVFVARRDGGPRVRSFDDPVLRRVKVGVQLIGDDFANSPPAHALGSRGIAQNVVGYSVYGDYATPNPPARIVEAVAKGDVAVAVVWGPLAGYFAQRSPVPLTLTPVPPPRAGGPAGGPALPFAFDIAMGVRRDDPALRQELDAILARRRPQVDSILAAYGVPRVDARRPAAGAPRAGNSPPAPQPVAHGANTQ